LELIYGKKVSTVMVNNSTNFNKRRTIEHWLLNHLMEFLASI